VLSAGSISESVAGTFYERTERARGKGKELEHRKELSQTKEDVYD